MAASLFGGDIKRPDLHRRDPFVEKRHRNAIGIVQEAVEVVIGGDPRGMEIVVGRGLTRRLLDVFGSGAGVVGTDGFAGKAPEQLGDRLAGHLSENVP